MAKTVITLKRPIRQLEIDTSNINSIEIDGYVQVVRCKYCKHREGTFHADRRRKEGGYWIHWCELDTGDPFSLGRNAKDDNWFCKDGERRDNG